MDNEYWQNCGDLFIIDRKSDRKDKNRYLYEGHFKGYSRTLYVHLYPLKKGLYANPDKKDEYGFICDKFPINKNIYFVWKNIERRCYYVNNANYKRYGALGVTVSDEFKVYSNFEKWFIENGGLNTKYDVDKDCISYLLNIPKKYSRETCLLIPEDINTFLSTVGKGIYITKYKFFCVRLRRAFVKLNRNFKTFEEAVNFKKQKDIECLEILISKHKLSEFCKTQLREYVKIYKYTSWT